MAGEFPLGQSYAGRWSLAVIFAAPTSDLCHREYLCCFRPLASGTISKDVRPKTRICVTVAVSDKEVEGQAAPMPCHNE
jgi:hypothetical protein